MSFPRYVALPLTIFLFWTLSPSLAFGQNIELTPQTPEQRFAAASGNWAATIVVGISYAKSMGGTAEDFGRHMAGLAVPGWGAPGSRKLDVIRGMQAGMMGFPSAEFEIADQTAESITARVNRPWASDFGETGMFWGVSLEEFESLWEVFGDALGDRFDMEYHHWIEGEWLFLRLPL